MRLLVVTPDYASHWYPLSAVAAEARRRGADVLVATGPSLRAWVEAEGYGWRRLAMSSGSNAGGGPVDDLGDFFAATRRGMVATLRQQAGARRDDLLWRPDDVARDVLALVGRERPDAVVVDHLAFAATLGLRAGGVPFTTFVPGHPSQLPVGTERYGFPVAWPGAIRPDERELDELWALCGTVTEAFTAAYNGALAAVAPAVEPVDDAFAAHGDDVLFNSPAALHPPGRSPLLPARHAFLGSCARDEAADAATAAWLDGVGDQPFLYVSFGTFLSARDDVLARVVTAGREAGVTAALATGVADVDAIGPLPGSWLVAPTLPQVAVLERAAAIVTHGGNNSVTEALRAGCPVVALPFSTDQFAVAADLERTGYGCALDPNAATPADVAAAVAWSLGPDVRARATALAATLTATPGPTIAADRLLTPLRF